MSFDDSDDRRLKFFGLGDYGTFFQVERAAEVLDIFDASAEDRSVTDVIELHNLRLFIENHLLEQSFSDSRRGAGEALLPKLRATVARYFRALDDTNLVDAVGGDVDWEYHPDLLQLLGEHKVYDRCVAATMFEALQQAHIGLGEMLANERLVRAYGSALRDRLLGDPSNAEHVVRKYLEKEARGETHLPREFDNNDAKTLLNAYLDAATPHLNVVGLIATARIRTGGIVDDKLKLKAQRTHKRLTEEFFSQNTGIRTGVEVVLSEDQIEPVETAWDDLVVKYAYSQQWLEATLDEPSILNNFIYVFAFVDERMLLTMPSHQSGLGVVDRFLTTSGRESYPAGTVFRLKESSSLLQMAFYEQFLASKGIELESVASWFFSSHLSAEYGAANFRYFASSSTSTYLQRCRHVLAEMESVAKQFSLFVENGELDTGLMGVAPDQVSYRELPSQLTGKYVYVTEGAHVQNVQHLLFSDQSTLTYINQDLRGRNLSDMLIRHQVSYDDFLEYQKRQVDYLIEQGILQDDGGRVWFAQSRQFRVLSDLFESEAASYYHYAAETRTVIDKLVDRGWLVRRSSLLAEPEAAYFNYCLNQRDFADGPNLRNKYLHGSHVDPSDENEHRQSYLVILKLLVALVIKMNDDFWLRPDEPA